MPKLLVRAGGKGHQVFVLPRGATIIGRGEDADLRFPNVSVSRHHASIELSAAAVVTDLASANGTLVNGEPINEPTTLKSGDEVRVGKFQLVFLGDTKDEQFYRGRYTAYLPPYKPVEAPAGGGDDATFAMSASALKAMQSQNRLVDGAKLTLVTNPKRFWFPENRTITFGNDGMVPVDGLFTWGVVAEVAWDGKRHVVTKGGWLCPVKVNGKATSKQGLRPGDQVMIGRSRFQYEVE
jgi:hypothetical protein